MYDNAVRVNDVMDREVVTQIRVIGSATVDRSEDVVSRGERLGDRLRQLRESAGHTQVSLGKELGYSSGWISSIERGAVPVTERYIRKIEFYFGVSIDRSVIESGVEIGRVIPIRGDMGDWGMTPTEVGQYVGYSRTSIYKFMKYWSEDVDVPAWMKLPWVNVDGLRRIKITDCAAFAQQDVSHCDTVPAVNVIEETLAIKEWLKTRRES